MILEVLAQAQLVTVSVPSPVFPPSWYHGTWRFSQVLHHGVSPYSCGRKVDRSP